MFPLPTWISYSDSWECVWFAMYLWVFFLGSISIFPFLCFHNLKWMLTSYIAFQCLQNVLLAVIWMSMKTVLCAQMEPSNQMLHRQLHLSNTTHINLTKLIVPHFQCRLYKIFFLLFQPSCLPCHEGGTTGGPGAVSSDSCGGSS